jgi:hypothetical protein
MTRGEQMNTSRRSKAAAGTSEVPHRLALAAKTVGGILSFSSLALGSAQFYKVSSARLGPGAFMLSIPKVLGGSLAPFLAVAGALGAVFGLSSRWLERGKVPKTAPRSRLSGMRARRPVDTLEVLAGLTGATMNAVEVRFRCRSAPLQD